LLREGDLGGATPITLTGTSPIVPDLSTLSGAQAALATVNAAIGQLASDRGTVGAMISRLSHTTEQLHAAENNLSAANSAITDAGVASESTTYVRDSLLVRSRTALLAQADSQPQLAQRLLT